MPDFPAAPPRRPTDPGDDLDPAAQLREKAKDEWAERIERYINEGRYTEAREQVKQALAEFPNDLGLRGLDSLAEHGLRRNAESSTLLREGRRLLQENRLDAAIDVLRRAERLEERNPESRGALAGALISRARELMSTNWHEAEPLVREALLLEQDNPVALSLGALIADYKRKEGGPPSSATAAPEPRKPINPLPTKPVEPVAAKDAVPPPPPPRVKAAPPTVAAAAPTRSTAGTTAKGPTAEGPTAKGRGAIGKGKRLPLFIGAAVAVLLLIVAAIFATWYIRNRAKPEYQQAHVPTKQAPVAPNTSTSPPNAAMPTPVEPTPAPTTDVPPTAVSEMVPFIVTANVPDAVVVVNSRELKTHLANGSLTLHRPAGKYRVMVRADDYEPVAEQMVELKAGAKPVALNFTLNHIAHVATLVIESVPADSEVLLDGNSIGIAGSGAFKKDVPPGNHTVTVRKPDYVDFVHYQQFTAGQTVNLSGADMKAYGKLVAKVTPANARVTYKRAGEQEAKPLTSNGTLNLPPGDYAVESKADGFFSDLQNITITSGKDSPYIVALKPTAVVVEKLTPAKVFANGPAWTFSDPDSWWTYAQKGFSFTRRDEGTLTFTLAKDTKPFMKERVHKYEFVADYKDEDNKILYSLDQHHLTRKVYVDGKELKDQRADVPVNGGDAYRLVVQILPDAIVVKVNGAADTAKRPEAHGKFAFLNEVVLTPR